MPYDFDTVIDRHNTNCVKWDYAEQALGVKDAIPMWVADMDFRSPEPVIEAVKKAAEHGIYGYSRPGNSYYEAFTSWMKRRHKYEVQRGWIEHTPGVVPAIHMAVKAYSQPGDEVIVQTPGYYPFFRAIKSNDRVMVENPLRLENGRYTMDLIGLEKSITPRTRMVILCSPHNPVGRVWTRQELTDFGEVCLRHRLVMLSDEIHSDLVYRPTVHTTFAGLSAEFAQDCVLCTGVSKTFNLPGLQVSNIIIPNPDLRKRFHDVVVSCGIHFGSVFGVAATESAYAEGEAWLDALLPYLKANIDYATRFIRERIPAIKVTPTEGTYLMWLDARALPVPPAKARTFMCTDACVGLEDGARFGCTEDGFWRMNVGCPRSILKEALERMETAVNALPRSR